MEFRVPDTTSTTATESSGGEDVGPRRRPDDDTPVFSMEALKLESNRLKTFAKWPVVFISPRALAKSGFVYTGSRDCVRCVFCG